MRIHDARLGRFLSVDPMANAFAMLTPYQYASNRPIDGIDMDGLEYATYHTRIDFGLSGYPGKITSSYYVWNNAKQHNSYGNLGPGILYQTDFYYNGKKMEPGVSRNEFVPRNEWVFGGLIQGDYGNYMGSTSLY